MLSVLKENFAQGILNVTVGDFDYPGIRWPSSLNLNPDEFNFFSVLLELGYAQMVREPTHILLVTFRI